MDYAKSGRTEKFEITNENTITSVLAFSNKHGGVAFGGAHIKCWESGAIKYKCNYLYFREHDGTTEEHVYENSNIALVVANEFSCAYRDDKELDTENVHLLIQPMIRSKTKITYY
jgi:hypothetical protein